MTFVFQRIDGSNCSRLCRDVRRSTVFTHLFSDCLWAVWKGKATKFWQHKIRSVGEQNKLVIRSQIGQITKMSSSVGNKCPGILMWCFSLCECGVKISSAEQIPGQKRWKTYAVICCWSVAESWYRAAVSVKKPASFATSGSNLTFCSWDRNRSQHSWKKKKKKVFGGKEQNLTLAWLLPSIYISSASMKWWVRNQTSNTVRRLFLSFWSPRKGC